MSEPWTKLQQLRTERSLTQEALANEVGISRSQLARLESGASDKNTAEAQTISELARALGTSVECLLADGKEEADIFFDSLEQLSHRELAVLKKGVGMYLENAPSDAVIAFYKALAVVGEIPEDQMDAWFAAACFYAFNKLRGQQDKEPMQLPVILGKIIGRETKKNEDPAEHWLTKRACNALDAAFYPRAGALYLINKLIRNTMQAGYNIDCKPLLKDMIEWDDRDDVARRWTTVMIEEIDKK